MTTLFLFVKDPSGSYQFILLGIEMENVDNNLLKNKVLLIIFNDD